MPKLNNEAHRESLHLRQILLAFNLFPNVSLSENIL